MRVGSACLYKMLRVLVLLRRAPVASPAAHRRIALSLAVVVAVLISLGAAPLVRAEIVAGAGPGSAEGLLSQDSREFIEMHLRNPRLPEILRGVTDRARTTRSPALTEGAIAMLSDLLKQEPDPQIALSLATIIQDQFSTQLEFYAPTGYHQGGTFWWRQLPEANYHRMAEALSIGFEHAENGSDLWRELGCALAKLRLIQGDWKAMNRILVRLEVEPITSNRRSLLSAPPGDWLVDPEVEWTLCGESMRSGDSGLVMEFVKDGRPLQGVHVCIRDWNGSPLLAPTETISSAPLADPHCFAPYPLPASWSHWARGNRTFGDLGPDNHRTRYAVSDHRGMVQLEKLPAIPIQVEAFVPTANFAEPGRGWTIEVDPVPPEHSEDFRAPPGDVVTAGPVVNLRPGRTVHYPRFTVYRLVDLNVVDWTDVKAVDLDSFVLSWPDQSNMWIREAQYEVEMGLYEGGEHPTVTPNYRYMTEVTKERVTTNRLAVGAHGVGGRRPSSGRTYGFQVTAYDRDGKVIGKPEIRRVRFLPERPERTLMFPSDRSLGTLRTREWGKYDSFDVGWTTLGEASGEVYIPDGLELRLDVTEGAVKDLISLVDLQPDALEMLVLSNTPADDITLTCITHLTGLQSLRLASTRITDRKACDLRHLRSLRELDLSMTNVSDHVAEYCFQSYMSLRNLNLLDTGVTVTGVAWMRHYQPDCNVVSPYSQSEIDQAYVVLEMDRRPREGRTDWEDLPGEKTVGVVRAPDGSPLAGAKAVLIVQSRFVIMNTSGAHSSLHPTNITGEDGKFVFPRPTSRFSVVVWHDDGFASVSGDRVSAGVPVELTIEAWSRIEGTYFIGSQPAPGRRIVLQSRYGVEGIHEMYEAHTDGEGHFALELVRPGSVTISEYTDIPIGCGGRSILYNYTLDLQLASGETARVNLGGVGRPVIGQVVLSNDPEGQTDWSKLSTKCRLEPADPQVPYPDGLSEEERSGWLEGWKQSPEGKAFRLAQIRCGKFPLRENGMLRIDDVPPGSYRLTIAVSQQFAPESCDFLLHYHYFVVPPPIGWLAVDFTMPEVPGGQSDEPLDLGTLTVEEGTGSPPPG